MRVVIAVVFNRFVIKCHICLADAGANIRNRAILHKPVERSRILIAGGDDRKCSGGIRIVSVMVDPGSFVQVVFPVARNSVCRHMGMTEHNHIHFFLRIIQILRLCLPEKILPVQGSGDRL
ncbi:hypothetical protein SDC9_106228 [bioreactor metagenome]|uniref:Uncharacterized protein n=1 Tax=bioreactor metagenome TaxID=1076179 RepID=A0A645B2T3_9ZZZZ